MVFFIPWRVVAEDSSATHFGFGGAMLLDLLGPAGRCSHSAAPFHERQKFRRERATLMRVALL
jgi:hypothetical protein